MYLLLRITPVFLAAAGLGLLLVLSRFAGTSEFLQQPFALLLGFCAYLLLLLAGLLFLGAGYPLKTRLRFLPFLFMTWAGGYGLFLFNDNPYVQTALMVLVPAMIWIWCESLFLYWQRSFAYQVYTLQRIARYLYLIALFLSITALTGFQVFVQQIPAWMMFLAAVFVFFGFQVDYFILQRLAPKESVVAAMVGSILAAEFLFVLYLLPTQFFLYGLLTALFFYLWWGVMTQVLQRKGDQVVVIPYITVSSLGAVLALATTLFIR